MEIAVLILIYWIWTVSLIKGLQGKISLILPSTAAMVLLSWQSNQTWGIVMTCIGAILLVISMIIFSQTPVNKRN